MTWLHEFSIQKIPEFANQPTQTGFCKKQMKNNLRTNFEFKKRILKIEISGLGICETMRGADSLAF